MIKSDWQKIKDFIPCFKKTVNRNAWGIRTGVIPDERDGKSVLKEEILMNVGVRRLTGGMWSHRRAVVKCLFYAYQSPLSNYVKRE